MTKTRAFILSAVIFLVLIGVALFLPREKPESIVIDYFNSTQQNSDWGNLKILDTEKLSGYSVVHVTYQAEPHFEPPSRWIVKDQIKVRDIGGGFTEWEGYVFLTKRGLNTWQMVQ